jgi:hypothetical protein
MKKVRIERFWCEKGFSYCPIKLERWLEKQDPTSKVAEPRVNAKRGIRKLFSERGHSVPDDQIAGGILDLLSSPNYSCNIVLEAYSKRRITFLRSMLTMCLTIRQ